MFERVPFNFCNFRFEENLLDLFFQVKAQIINFAFQGNTLLVVMVKKIYIKTGILSRVYGTKWQIL